MINQQRVLTNSEEQQVAIVSNSEQSNAQLKIPDRTPDARVLLYFLKPPFPSGGGSAAASAAASAGRVGPSTFTIGNLAHVVRFEQRRFKAHPGRPKDGRPTPL
jgi:hypothetical protein